MYPSSLLGALLLAVPTLGVPGVSSIPSGPNSPAELQPIDIKAFESAFGIQRRTAVKLSALDPQTQEQLIYGRPGGTYTVQRCWG